MGLITLAEAKTHMNIDVATWDTEIQAFIDSVTAVVENVTGPMTDQTFTEYFDGGGAYVVLGRVPVISVTSVTEYAGTTGTTITAQNIAATTANDYLLNTATGIMRRMSSGAPTLFTSGTQNLVVVYHAGYATVPDAVKLATKELVRILYDQTQLGGAAPGPADEFGVGTGPGYLIPNRIKELLAPYRRAPAVA